jgi:hypothetical protein
MGRWMVVGALALTTGCAAVLGSKEKQFDLTSTPAGADVYANGNRLGTTPVKVKLSNQKEQNFVFKLDGHKDASCTLARGTDGGWVVLDVFMGLVPVIIDAATNSWSQTKGNSCSGNLEPLEPAVAQGPIAPIVTGYGPSTRDSLEQELVRVRGLMSQFDPASESAKHYSRWIADLEVQLQSIGN